MRYVSVIPRMGGKYELIDKIMPIIMECICVYRLDTYAEICGGGARLLLALLIGTVPYRIYNEVSRGVYSIFKILTEYHLTCEFIGKVEALGYSREVFEQAKELINLDEKVYRETGKYMLSDMDAAIYAYVLSIQSRAANMETYSPSKEWGNQFVRLSKLLQAHEILKDVEMYNEDCFTLLAELKNKSNVLIYLDPPYIPLTMQNPKTYGENSWTLEKHKELVKELLDTQAKVVLSGYDDGKTYAILEQNGWTKHFVKEVKLNSSCQKTSKKESIWVNWEISLCAKANLDIENDNVSN